MDAEVTAEIYPEETFGIPGFWMPINGYEGKYLISNYGSVWSWPKGQLLKGSLDRYGHRRINLCAADLSKQCCGVHRLVMLHYGSPPPSPDHVVIHIDLDKQNNYVGNLRWATRQEVMRRAAEAGLISGERGSTSRFTDEDIAACLKYLNKGYSSRQVGELLGISPSYVRDLRCGAWRKNVTQRNSATSGDMGVTR